MEYVGSPLPESVLTELKKLSAGDDSAVVTRRVQELLDPLCLAGVEQCWKSKQYSYAEDVQVDAKAAYDHARKVYQKLVAEGKDE